MKDTKQVRILIQTRSDWAELHLPVEEVVRGFYDFCESGNKPLALAGFFDNGDGIRVTVERLSPSGRSSAGTWGIYVVTGPDAKRWCTSEDGQRIEASEKLARTIALLFTERFEHRFQYEAREFSKVHTIGCRSLHPRLPEGKYDQSCDCGVEAVDCEVCHLPLDRVGPRDCWSCR
jgi:hypothetical protein